MWLAFILFASFLGIYLNTWFLLSLFENKSRLFEKKQFKKLPFVSILIPAHNEEETIANTLESVLNLDYPRDKLEVMVIENGSKDGTAEIVKKFKGVKLITQREPGKAKALNVGVERARGEVVGILDADTIVASDCLKKMIGHLESKKVAGAATFIKVDDGKKNILAKIQKIEYLLSAVTKKIFSLFDSFYILPGTLSLIKKDLVKEVKFSEDTITEDMDLALSLKKKGYKIVQCLDAVSWTVIPKDIKSLTKQRIRWYRGFMENTKKHSDVFFNRKLSHLGYFIFPMAYLSIFIGLILFAYLIFNNIHDFLVFTKTISYIPLLSYLNGIDFINLTTFLQNPYFFIALLLTLLSSLLVFSLFLRVVGVSDKKTILILPAYMYAYYALVMVYWVLAFSMEITGYKRKW